MKLYVMADKPVGYEIVKWLIDKYKQDIAFVLTSHSHEIMELCKKFHIPTAPYYSKENVVNEASKCDMGLLAWWPSIVEKDIINAPKRGFLNTHPSLLPFGRGKNPNFWSLVEETKFGVSLNMVGDKIDDGPIVAQKEIPIGWTDSGKSLYMKAQDEIVELFKISYPKIRDLDFTPRPQDTALGTFHLKKELDEASFLELSKEYKLIDLLNKLRARSFHPWPGCWFKDNGIGYDVRIDITRRKKR
jgi:methionyl-tRNA formyltransferase